MEGCESVLMLRLRGSCGGAAQVSLAGFLRRQQRTQDSGPLIRRRLDRHPNREGHAAQTFVRDNLVLWRIMQLISGRDFLQPLASAHRARWGALGHFRIVKRSTILRNMGRQPTRRERLRASSGSLIASPSVCPTLQNPPRFRPTSSPMKCSLRSRMIARLPEPPLGL